MSVNKNRSDEEILHGCYRGDSEPIKEFYDKYKDLVYSATHKWTARYAGRRANDDDIAEIFQNAFVYMMENGFAKMKQARDQNNVSALVFIIAYQRAGKYFNEKSADKQRRM